MQGQGRLVSHEVVEHFATLLKQGDVPSDGDPAEAKSSLENVVRPAAFNKGSDLKTSATALDLVAAEDEFSQIGELPARQVHSDAPEPPIKSDLDRADPGEPGRSEFAAILEKIEAAGASMRLAEERANRQTMWTQDFLATAKTRLRDAELRNQESERRAQLLEMRAETAERDLETAEQRCRATEKRLEMAESRLEAAEQRLQAALELARSADLRAAAAAARAVEAERWMQDVLHTVQKEFPTGQFL